MKALLLVDMQKGLTKRALYDKDNFIITINQAISKYRVDNDIIIFIQHENKQLVLDSPDWEIDDNILSEPNDRIFSKQKGDAFTSTSLVEYLNENSITNIVIGGLVTHGCIKSTCLGGVKLGYTISLLKGAHTSWAKDALSKIDLTEKSLAASGIISVDVNDL